MPTGCIMEAGMADVVNLKRFKKRVERQQSRIAGPGAGKPNVARFEDRNAGAARRQGVPRRHEAVP